MEGVTNPKVEMILHHASNLDPKLSGSFARAAHYQGRRPQALPVEKRHLRTCPWSGQAAVMSASIAIESCLPLRGSVILLFVDEVPSIFNECLIVVELTVKIPF